MKKSRIAILGEGLTAKCVKQFCKKEGFDIVSPEEAELVIASPGIPPEQYPHCDAEIISDIEWAYRLFKQSNNPPKLIAVTGTNGKSTVTAMISHVIDAPYAGNIGIPLINYVGLENEFPVIVVELSSYQLESCSQFKPDIAVFLNMEEDHLARHKTMDEYAKQKTKCFIKQDENDVLIFNAEDERVAKLAKRAESKKVSFSDKQLNPDLDKLNLVGLHNKVNAQVALLVAAECGISEKEALGFLISYKGLRHRLELVTEQNGVAFYNDSKATNPSSTLVALDAFDAPVHLMLCGEDKKLALHSFIEAVQKRAATVITFGDISSRYVSLSKEIDPNFCIIKVDNLEQAIQKSIELSDAGEVVLFSPSSSSYDQFTGFESRGDAFVEHLAEVADEILV